MAGNSLLDRFRIFRRPIIVGACAITTRRRSRAAIPIAGTAGARSDGSAAAAVLVLAALMKDGRDEANGALSPSRRSAKAGFRWACRWSKGWRHWATPWGDCVGWRPKDLVGIQWRVAFGQQDEGWCLRRDNVW